MMCARASARMHMRVLSERDEKMTPTRRAATGAPHFPKWWKENISCTSLQRFVAAVAQIVLQHAPIWQARSTRSYWHMKNSHTSSNKRSLPPRKMGFVPNLCQKKVRHGCCQIQAPSCCSIAILAVRQHGRMNRTKHFSLFL